MISTSLRWAVGDQLSATEQDEPIPRRSATTSEPAVYCPWQPSGAPDRRADAVGATPRVIGLPATATLLPIVSVNQRNRMNLTNQIPQNDTVDVAFDRSGVVRQRKSIENRFVVAAQATHEPV